MRSFSTTGQPSACRHGALVRLPAARVQGEILRALRERHDPRIVATLRKPGYRFQRLRDNPSLAGSVAGIAVEEYPATRADAIDETGLADSVFPERYPFAGDELLDAESWPE